MENLAPAAQPKQYTSDSINELATALSKAQGEMGHAGKTADNPFFKSKYADLSAVIDAARPALAKHGLSVVQIPDVDAEGNVTLITQLCHASGQWIRSWYPVKPVKADPQGLGSAITYSRRYAYSAITGVAAADEDDDDNAASGKNDNSVTNGKVSAKTAYGSSKNMKLKWTEISQKFTSCKTLKELESAWEDAKPDLSTIASIDRQLYDSLVEIAKQRRAAISKPIADDRGDEIQGREASIEEGAISPEEQAEYDRQEALQDPPAFLKHQQILSN